MRILMKVGVLTLAVLLIIACGGGDTGDLGEPSSDGSGFIPTATPPGGTGQGGTGTGSSGAGQDGSGSSSDTGQATDGDLNEDDRAVLEAFYQATGGDNWNDNSNWLNSLVPISLWHGIETDSQGRVVSISLPSNNLVGEVPRALENLPALRVLDLGFNNLEGCLSTEVQARISIEESDLSGVTFCCEGLPHPSQRPASQPLLAQTSAETDRDALLAIFDATNGEDWDQSGTWATARSIDNWQGVYVDKNGRVVRLDLNPLHERTFLTGTLPAELGNLQQLRELRIRGGGPIPPELGSLQNLWSLSLYGPFCEAIPPELGNLENLAELRLGGGNVVTSLTGDIPPELGSLRNLERLDIINTHVSGELPPELANLQNLTYVSFVRNRLGGEIPAELDDWLYLNTLDLSGNYFSGCVADFTGKGLTADQLEYRNNNPTDFPPLPACTGIDPDDEARLVALYQALGEPRWLHNWLQRDVPAWEWANVGADREGRVVSLHFGSIGGRGYVLPPEIGDFPNLRHLYVDGGRLPPEVVNLQNLQTLSIIPPSEMLQDDLEKWGQVLPLLAELQDLQSLYISVLQFLQYEIPPEWGAFRNLRSLNARGLTGEIPPELGNVQTLEHLALGSYDGGRGSYNSNDSRWYVRGPLPPELGNLVNLRTLAIGGGQLSGAIPPEFGNLVNLRTLSLPHNNTSFGPSMSPPLPAELANLVNLDSLNLEGSMSFTEEEIDTVAAELCGWLDNVRRVSTHSFRVQGDTSSRWHPRTDC